VRHFDDAVRPIGDFDPLHVDDAFATRSRYGARILHGAITAAPIGAEFGVAYAGSAIGYLEHDARFVVPVQIDQPSG